MKRRSGASGRSRLGAAVFFALLWLGIAPAAGAQERDAAPEVRASASGSQSTPATAVPETNEPVQDENDEYRHSAAVVKIGSLFGMGPEAAATAFTIFNLVILVAGIGYVLLKMLPRMLRDRNTAIQRKLVDARTATEEASARLGAVEARLARLDDQIAGMRQEAEAANAREADRLRESVEGEKANILASADAEIQAATVSARRQIQQYAAELAIEHAARRLVVTAEADRLLIENFARQLADGKGGQN